MTDPLRNQRDRPKFGASYVDGCSFDLGTDAAPFDKYPGVTGLHRIRNTGTTAWPPGSSINIGDESYRVPDWLDKPVLEGEEVVVGIHELHESAPISELRAEPGNLKAERQPPARTGCGSWVHRRFRYWLVLLGICSRTSDWPLGSPPPSPPPGPPGGSDSEAGEEQRNAAGKRPNVAAGGRAGSKRRAAGAAQRQVHAADDAAASSSGSAANKKQRRNKPVTFADTYAEEGGAGAAPAAVASRRAKKTPAAAATPKAAARKAKKTPAVAAPEEHVEAAPAAPAAEHQLEAPDDATEALMAAITRFGGKGKVTDLHFAALTVATHAADVRCAPLTADSDLAAIAKACPALARALGELNHDQMNKADKDKRKALQGELAFPSPQLKEAFRAHLRAEAAQAGGGPVEMAVEAELAARRVLIVLALILPAAAPSHVKQKDFFRRIREVYPDAWVASCGVLLAKANAALDTLTADGRATAKVPQSVVDKWEAAVLRAYGYEFKKIPTETGSSREKVTGAHLYRFSLAPQGAFPHTTHTTHTTHRDVSPNLHPRHPHNPHNPHNPSRR